MGQFADAFLHKKKEKVRDVPSLLKRTSVLLKEGYIFSDALFMLLPYHVQELEKWNGKLQQDFNNGASVTDILKNFPIPKHLLLTIQLAEEKGELAETLSQVSEQMKFQQDLQKNVGKLLAYPAFLMMILTIIFVVFRNYFLPNIQQITANSDSEELTSLKLAVVLLHFPDFLLLSLVITFIFIVSCRHYFRKWKVREQLKIIMKIPIVRSVYQYHFTRQFSYLIGSLLVSGISLQQALSILEEQKTSHYVSYIATQLKQRVIFGDSLSEAVKVTQFFASNFEEFIKHGERSGYLGREMLIFSEMLYERMQSILKTCMAAIQPLFFILIAICIIAAYISMLLPIYDLVEIM
ncbi:competence type IV pilus assembly protein ComGB [Ureibacillus thermophilus]|uniref:Chromosome partitioning protein ParA n=1 Tax=Ureibacillus thermophilus TaxID=367743 RepID=A0A4V1A352_9BACL|nr:competence type IV pilus assembly protein ComGB [Ureibacillus thermophilus]QBK26040.1 chromosome partitioning protein ParA [Ureibacillus thermophilus]